MDTSVIFAAVLSDQGGARKLFQLGEAGVIQLVAGPNVLRECEEVVRRKVPDSLPTLAYLLELAGLEITSNPQDEQVKIATSLVEYEPDAYVLAEAMASEPDWFITHDKQHFLKIREGSSLAFQLGTPGDLIQSLGDEFTQGLD
ncbi:MAG: PIN domain-containing protein [Chloroflexi bacterium]|nr:PIN domain-containing protein [Chloroflexota bacterium]